MEREVNERPPRQEDVGYVRPTDGGSNLRARGLLRPLLIRSSIQMTASDQTTISLQLHDKLLLTKSAQRLLHPPETNDTCCARSLEPFATFAEF